MDPRRAMRIGGTALVLAAVWLAFPDDPGRYGGRRLLWGPGAPLYDLAHGAATLGDVAAVVTLVAGVALVVASTLVRR